MECGRIFSIHIEKKNVMLERTTRTDVMNVDTDDEFLMSPRRQLKVMSRDGLPATHGGSIGRAAE